MSTSSTDRVAPTPEEINRCYLEYRRACYRILHRHATARGLIDVLTEPRTAAQLVKLMGFLPEREETLRLLLDALVRFGSLREAGGTYESVRNFEDREDTYDTGLIAAAIGSDMVEGLLHGDNYAGIVDVLYQEDNPVAAAFDSENADLWDEFLQTPYYQYSRQWAVERIARPGAEVLDLACGPGFGLCELADAVGPEGRVVGVEISPSFVETARQRTVDLKHVTVRHGDLDQGLGTLGADKFDGAMIVGAYHFLTRPDRMFEDVARLLRPGGRLCIAYVLSRLDAYDRELMALRFSLRHPPSNPPTREAVLRLAEGAGFRLLPGEFAIGSWPSYGFERIRP